MNDLVKEPNTFSKVYMSEEPKPIRVNTPIQRPLSEPEKLLRFVRARLRRNMADIDLPLEEVRRLTDVMVVLEVSKLIGEDEFKDIYEKLFG